MNNLKLYFLGRITESSSLRGLYLIAFAAVTLGYGEYFDKGIIIGLGILGILSILLPDKFKSIDAIVDIIKNNFDFSKTDESKSVQDYYDTAGALTQDQINNIKDRV